MEMLYSVLISSVRDPYTHTPTVCEAANCTHRGTHQRRCWLWKSVKHFTTMKQKQAKLLFPAVLRERRDIMKAFVELCHVILIDMWWNVHYNKLTWYSVNIYCWHLRFSFFLHHKNNNDDNKLISGPFLSDSVQDASLQLTFAESAWRQERRGSVCVRHRTETTPWHLLLRDNILKLLSRFKYSVKNTHCVKKYWFFEAHNDS